MEVYEFTLIAAALSVVAADAIIRLRLAPARRDRLLKQLLSVAHGSGEGASGEGEQREGPALTDSLLKHFQQSFTSRQIVQALAGAPSGMTQKELEERVNEFAVRSEERSLPSSAVRKVLMILMGAGFVRLADGRFRMTDIGWALDAMLRTPREQFAERRFAGAVLRLT